MGKALSVARKLRLAGHQVDMYSETAKKVGKAFNYADRVGAVRVAFVAPSEWEQGLVRIKDLRNFGPDATDAQKQKDVPVEDLANIDQHFGVTLEGQPVGTAGAAAGAAAPAA